MSFCTIKRPAMIFGNANRLLENGEKSAKTFKKTFASNPRTYKNVIAGPKIDIQSFESTLHNLKQRFQKYLRENLPLNTLGREGGGGGWGWVENDYLRGRMLDSLSFDLVIDRLPVPCFRRRA